LTVAADGDTFMVRLGSAGDKRGAAGSRTQQTAEQKKSCYVSELSRGDLSTKFGFYENSVREKS
jgi:hypothetical protein